jgi:hypothetical protein
MKKKKMIIIICSTVILLIMAFIGSYAYFSGIIKNDESGTTITFDSGEISINYAGGPNIYADDLYPHDSSVATKIFTVTANNNSNLLISYSLNLVIDENGFTKNGFEYSLVSTNISNNGTTANNIELSQITYGINNYSLGNGTFGSGEDLIHSYDLEIYYKDNDTDQSSDKGSRFAAHISVSLEPLTGKTLLSQILGKDNSNVSDPLTTIGSKNGYSIDDSLYVETHDITQANGNYWTYGTSYTINNNKFTLNNVSKLKYDTNYADLIGKFLPSLLDSNNSDINNIFKNYSNLDYIAYVTNSTSSSITLKLYDAQTSTKEAILASTPDDYGTSYYYRGLVENNYIVFANMCWRIVRITGNNAIKLVLYNSNKNGVTNPCDSSQLNDNSSFISKSVFNEKFNDNSYVGYMYGSVVGSLGSTPLIQTSEPIEYKIGNNNYYFFNNYGYSSENQTFKLISGSIKGSWSDATFRNNVITNYIYTGLSSSSVFSGPIIHKVVSSVDDTTYKYYPMSFENLSSTYDEAHEDVKKSSILLLLENWYKNNLLDYSSFIDDVVWCNDKSTTGTGYGITPTNYNGYTRLNGNPTLICPNDNSGGKLSKFTAEDITNGNGLLDYPIGLLTSDEIVFAGKSFGTYLTKGAINSQWWTLTPASGSLSSVYYWDFSVANLSNQTIVNKEKYVRPSIAIKGTIKVAGIGTSSNPYTIIG